MMVSSIYFKTLNLNGTVVIKIMYKINQGAKLCIISSITNMKKLKKHKFPHQFFFL